MERALFCLAGIAGLLGCLVLPPAAQAQTGRRMPLPPRVQVRQWSPTAGGPAALGTLLQAYGRRLGPAQLERLCAAEGRKATLAGLESAAEAARFRARIVQAGWDTLPRQPLPAVAEWRDGEFRVFIATRPGEVEVFDPASGE